MSTIVYELGDDVIEYQLYDITKTVYFEYSEFVNPKCFFTILSQSINDFIDKQYVYAVQTVYKHEWDTILKKQDKWEIIDSADDCLIIRCKLEDAFDLMFTAYTSRE